MHSWGSWTVGSMGSQLCCSLTFTWSLPSVPSEGSSSCGFPTSTSNKVFLNHFLFTFCILLAIEYPGHRRFPSHAFQIYPCLIVWFLFTLSSGIPLLDDWLQNGRKQKTEAFIWIFLCLKNPSGKICDWCETEFSIRKVFKWTSDQESPWGIWGILFCITCK